MKITVVGCGYVGLVSGACLAKIGHTVILVDIDKTKIKALKSGFCPIYEPGLAEILAEGRRGKRIEFTSDLKAATRKTDVIFIAVGTPPLANGDADLSHIENVAKVIAKEIDHYKLIVEKSTVPVQTGEKLKQTLRLNASKNADFDVASNPEFLREGSAVKDFMNPDRLIIGVENERSKKILSDLYEPLKAKILFTDIKSAEIIKHASNSFLATKISFINAISRICDAAKADVEMVSLGMGLDARIGPSFLNAGLGFGGFCFPKDLSAFIKISEKLGYDFELLKSVQKINDDQKKYFIHKIEEAIWNINSKTIAVLGLSFKPNTDDMRFAPSIEIIEHLQSHGAKIQAYDPHAMNKAKSVLKNVRYCKDVYTTCKNADCLLLLTEWDEFKKLDFAKVKKVMKHAVIVDGRNIYDPKKLKALGFSYHCIGRS